jgi:outer membrane protein assembly factor BamB
MMAGTFRFLILSIGLSLFSQAVLASPGNEVFKDAEEAYLEGDFERGTKKIEELISSNPGDFDLAARALHRLCLSEYAQLVSRDWPSGGFPKSLFRVSGKDHSRMWESLSEYLEEAFLEFGKNARAGGLYPFPPPRALESLWRKRRDYPLTPLKDVPTSAAERILALRRSGYLENDAPAVIDASILLYFIHQNAKRYNEASKLVDDLVGAKNKQIDWLLARAKFHARIKSPRAEALSRQLFAKLDKPGVDQSIAQASERAKGIRETSLLPPREKILPGQPWINQLTLETDDPAWQSFADGFVQGMEEQIDLWIQGTFADEEDKVYLLRRDGTGSAIRWNVIDDRLKSLGQGSLNALRKLQEKRFQSDPSSLDSGSSTQARKLSLFRRYPWSQSAHKGLSAYARKELQAGRGQAAFSAFREVLEHTLDKSLAKRARVGSWLALSQLGLREELADELDEHAGKSFPWMKKELPSEEIGKILAQVSTVKNKVKLPGKLAALRIQSLRLPASRLWNSSGYRYCSGIEFVAIQETGSGLLASTRNLLARYETGKTTRPLWSQTSPVQDSRSLGRPGKFSPVVSDGVIFTRWGYGADPGQLVAMDLKSREILWSLNASGPQNAGRKIPLGNPVLSGGQLFVASAWSNRSGSSVYTFRINCIDAASGKIAWTSDQEVLLPMSRGNSSFEGVYGDCITVERGKIYCAPGTGFVARFDARAGRMEWMRNYRPFTINQMIADSMGTAPLLDGDALYCLPRDSNTLYAIDSRTGELIWESFLPLPKEILGIRAGRILVRGLTGLIAFDARNGRVIWEAPYPEDFLRQAYLRGSSIYLATQEKLYRYEAETGIERETRGLPNGESTLFHFALLGGSAYLVGDQPSPMDSKQELASKGAGELLWELPANDAKAFHSEDLDLNKSKLILFHNEVLSCRQASTGKILWEKFVYPSPTEVYFHEGKAILAFIKSTYDLQLEAYDLEKGTIEWKLRLPRLRSGHGSIYGRSGKYFYGRDNTDGYVLADLAKGEVVMRNRVSRRNGQVKPGFGGGRVHFMIIPAYRTGLQWLSWDLAKNEFVGEKEPLRGVDEDPSKTFDRIMGNWLEDAQYGDEFCYFVNRQDQGKREYVAYRANYEDRAVRVVARSPGIIKLKAPYFFLQQEQSETNKKTRTHTWKIRKADYPKYSHTLDLGHSWVGNSFRHGNCILDVRTPVRNQNPYLVQAYDLVSKKLVFKHSSEDAERMGVLLTGSNRVLVYEYRKHKKTTDPYFKLTPYDLATGQAGKTINLDYWSASRHNPHQFQLAGNLLLIREHQTLRAWNVSF